MYRGKKSDGKWIYGSLIKFENPYVNGGIQTFIVPKNVKPIDITLLCGNKIEIEALWVEPKTVGEIVGFKDKKDNDIYEGDFVSLNTYSWEEPEDSIEGIIIMGPYGVGIAGVDCAGRKDCYWIKDVEAYINHYEVHGNKFDNPELLQEVE